jgi:uncharacterized protein (TIGR03067 family)
MTTPADPRLQGVWKLLSCTSRGTDVFTSATHRVFVDALTWEIDPHHVVYDDQPPPESRVEIDTATAPARLTVYHPLELDDGSVGERPRRALYAIDGDRLTIAWTSFRDFPVQIDGHDGPIDRFARETDADLVARYSAPLARVQRFKRRHPDLGELVWDANLDWWTGHVAWADHPRVRLHLNGANDAGGGLFDRAAAILRKLDARAVYRHAAAGLLKVHNEGWRTWQDQNGNAGETPVLNAEQFMAKLSPDSVTVDGEGAVNVCLYDGQLFWGHAIIVNLDASLNPTDVDIAG